MDVLIQVRDAGASRGNRSVLRGVDLVVHRGEILALIGVNGAGKSTLVDVLTGRHPLDRGSMVLADEPYLPSTLAEAEACGVGLIAQNSEPPSGMTVAEALFRNTYRAREPHEELRERAMQLAVEAEVELDVDAPVLGVDRGTRAIVEIVRMLAEEAQFVVIDEIAVTLADHEIAVLHHVLHRLADQGRGILYITHRMDEIPSIADRVVVVRDGVITDDRPTAGIDVEGLSRMLLGEEEAAVALAPAVRAEQSHDGANGVADRPDAVAFTALGLCEPGRLDSVSVHVRSGEILGITGTHDSGARELMEILGGSRQPESGRIERRGVDVAFTSTVDAERHGVSYLPDGTPTDAADQRLVDGLAGDSGALVDEIRRARRMIELVQTLRINTTDITAAVGDLSGGDQQKADLVRTIERGGDVLVLTHPTRGIDVGARRALLRFLRELTGAGAAVIVLGADMTELLEWSDRIVVLEGGTIALEGRAVDLDEDALVQAVLGRPAVQGSGRRSYQQ